MTIEFQKWPAEFAARYRERGYWIDQPLTRALDQQLASHPEATAIICGKRRFSYKEIDRLATNLAIRLSKQGLTHGNTAIVQLPNIAEFYVVFFALLKIGVAPVNALFNHRKLELTGYAQQVGPSLIIASRNHELFADNSFFDTLSSVTPQLRFGLFLGEQSPSSSLDQWLRTPAEGEADFSPTAPDEVAFFQLSGGSTGTPKLIPRTHNDYDYSVRASREICGLTSDTKFLCALPCAHNFTMSSPGALGVFDAGGCVVMAQNPEPSNCFALIEQHEVSITALVPSALALWLQAAPKHDGSLESLKLIQVGGANFAESHARQVPGVFGCRLQQVFGMAEGLVNYTRFDDDDLIFTTQGRPISPDDEIKIVGEDGSTVPNGETGILATRGPYTFRGYYRSPEHSATVFDTDGFYYSGDLVQRLNSGHLRVVGRVKDQINRGGEKIASEEVENLLLLHPDVDQAALVAMNDTLLGEKSCAFVVTSNPDLTAPVLRRHLLALGIAEYKLPDRVRFIKTIPLTAFGKPNKKKLREQLTHSPAPALT